MLAELMVGDHVQLQNLRGKHPLKSDQSGVVTAKHAFNSYSVRISGSGLITVRNRVTLRKISPVVQIDNLVFGQGQKAVQRPDGAQLAPGAGPELRPRPDKALPGRRPDMTVRQSTGRASTDHSQAVGGAGGGPEEVRGPADLPESQVGLILPGLPDVSVEPVQEGAGGVEQRVQPGGNIESQVDLTLPRIPLDNVLPRRGTRIRVQPDKFQAG